MYKMKYSRQREKILNILNEYKIHPTADCVYAILCSKGEKMSLATVYRNLKILSETGVIKKFKTSEKTERYDSTLIQHYHFLCTECGNVFDMPANITADISKNAAELGFEVKKYDMMLSGICPQCKKKEN